MIEDEMEAIVSETHSVASSTHTKLISDPTALKSHLEKNYEVVDQDLAQQKNWSVICSYSFIEGT